MPTPPPGPPPPAPPAFRDTESFALDLDRADPLRAGRELFHIPTVRGLTGKTGPGADAPSIYLTGNSLGCMPRAAREAVVQELDDWQHLGVEAHLRGKHPWLPYHEGFRDMGARLVGGRPGEVVMMNSLTVNLHLMMVSFYRPTPERYRIVIEDAAFPSDSYAVQTQAAFHGLDPADAVVRLRPREGEHTLRTEDIVEYLRMSGRHVALVLLGGVNYLTGQWFDMPKITAAGHEAGALVGWDLAHGAGNVPTQLHEWGADFAVWCSYKYLNAGPGAVAGCFVHEKHGKNTQWRPGGDGGLPRFAGWWGNEPAMRFKMRPEFVARAGADSWQLSNPPILSMAPLRTSLEIFDKFGIGALREKSIRLTGYLEWLLTTRLGEKIQILTPRDPGARGCALSIAVKAPDAPAGKELLSLLVSRGVACDFREPNVIRAAPVPLYNTFHDVWRFVDILGQVMRS